MKVPFVDLKSQYLSIKNEIDSAISGVIENTSFIGGPIVKQFEANFAKNYGVKHCIGVANGTDAIYITMRMLGIGAGDEVITTAHSWISTSETISQTGARPVFVDIEEEYFTIDPVLIENKITDKTKAIIPVHIYGQMCDMDKITDIAKRHNLYVIEDCAQSHFSNLNGVRAGLSGIAGTFSFFPGKNLGAYGDAGCIITNDDELAVKVRMYANHGALVKHDHKMEGINSRLDTLHAAVLNVKLKYIQDWTQARIDNSVKYNNQLGDISGLIIPKVRENTKHSFHLYVIRTDHRDALKAHLAEDDIPTVIHYPKIIPLQPAYDYIGHSSDDFPVAYKYQQQILSLPMFPELSDEQIEFVSASIRRFYEKNQS